MEVEKADGIAEVEIHHHSPRAGNDSDQEDLSLDKTNLVEIEYEGQTYMMNMRNNDVIDSDDGEKLGTAILDDDDELKVIDIEWDDDKTEDLSESDSDDSDDEE